MSFANEVRDFLAGYQMVAEMGEKRAAREQDKAYNDAMLDLRQQELDLNKEELNLRREAQAARAAVGKSSGLTPYQAASLGIRERELALREAAAEDEKWTDIAEALPSDGTEVNPDEFLTPEYAEGGMVEDARKRPAPASALPMEEPAAYTDPMGNTTGAPDATPAPAPAPAPVTPKVTEVKPETAKAVESKASEAAGQAMRSFLIEKDKPAAAIADEREDPGLDIASNKGGMSFQEYEQAVKAIDPNNQIPAYMKSAAMLAEGYNYFMERGQPEKAVRFAKQILVTQKQMSQTLGNLALNAMEQGDVQSACKLFNDACNKFPSANEISVQPGQANSLIYTVKDAGKVVDQGQMNTQQFWELATGVSNGSLFIKQIAQFVKAQPKQERAVDFDSATAATVEAYNQFTTARDQYQTFADAGDTDSEEARAAYEAAVQAQQAFRAAEKQALELGAKEYGGKGRAGRDKAATALRQAINDAANTALGPAPAEGEANSGGNEQGWGSWLLRRANPLTALQDDVSMVAGAVTGGGNEAPAQELAYPKSKEEFDALPSGTRFVDPNGVLRIKP